MSFFGNLKHALGFGNHESYEEELEGIDARVTPMRKRKEAETDPAACTALVSATHMVECEARVAAMAGALVQPAEGEESAAQEETPPAATDEIFESVVKIFNETLPDFLKSTVDEKLQREYLYEALSVSMKQHLQSLAEAAREECSRRYENERINMHREMENLRQKSQKMESDSSESKKLQLSAERQKRALTERISEMEKQMATLQAENEQYALENKGLINKLRLVAVQGGDTTVAVADLVAGAEQSARIEELTQLTTQLTEANAHLVDTNDKLTSAATHLTEEVDRLTAELSASQQSAEKADREAKENLAALSMGRSRHSAAMAEMQQTLEKAQSIADIRIRELEERLADLTTRHEEVTGELTEANRQLEVVEEINSRLEKLEEAKQANDALVRRQKEELKLQEEQLHSLQAEINGYADTLKVKERLIASLESSTESLRKSLDDNLYRHTQTESAMRAEIERLRSNRAEAASAAADEVAAPYVSTPPVSTPPSPSRRGGSSARRVPRTEEILLDFTFMDSEGNEVYNPSKPAAPSAAPVEESTAEAPAPKRTRRTKAAKTSKVKISAIDTTLEDTDWLLATPPPRKKGDAPSDPSANPDFGYQEPAKKPIIPDNPAQMSLW